MVAVRLRLLLVLGLTACSTSGRLQPPASSPNDVAEVERTVREAFFGAIERFDRDALSAAVTPDFELVEDTLRLDLPGFWKILEPFRGNTSIAYRFSEFRTEVHRDVAWTSYRNEAVMRREGRAMELVWLETAILQRINGRWKVDRLQSTPVEPR